MKQLGFLGLAAQSQASQAGGGFSATRQASSTFTVTGQNPDGSEYRVSFPSEAEARQFLDEKRREAEAAGYKVNESETVIERSVPPRRPPMRTGTPGSQPPMVIDPQTGQPAPPGSKLQSAAGYGAAGGLAAYGGAKGLAQQTRKRAPRRTQPPTIS